MKKIDIYVRYVAKPHFHYICSTNKAETCKDAISRLVGKDFRHPDYGLMTFGCLEPIKPGSRTYTDGLFEVKAQFDRRK